MTRPSHARQHRATLGLTPDPVLANLGALASGVAAAADPAAVYRALYRFAAACTPTDSIFVALYDAERRQRICVYSAGPEGDDDVSALPPMPMSGSPQSRAITTGRPIVTADLQGALAGKPVVTVGLDADPRLPQSSLAVPLIVFGRTIGAFEVQSLEPAAYTESHIIAMQLAADIAALAMDRLRTIGAERAREAESIRCIIDASAFSTVFQPIVALDSRATFGFEALTRFADGTSPDVRFVQAAACGLGLELEIATLESAFLAAQLLPANTWLNLNVSPRLVLAEEPLGSLLRRWGWQTILELTEHVAVDDYDALRAALARLGESVRLAVDDAGAGFASFRHILELGPQFVKLDRWLVTGIDADPARQAFVAGMCHFAVTTGCDLIAEGIETESELQALRVLGVSLGQGYYLGRPAAPRPLAPMADSVALLAMDWCGV